MSRHDTLTTGKKPTPIGDVLAVLALIAGPVAIWVWYLIKKFNNNCNNGLFDCVRQTSDFGMLSALVLFFFAVTYSIYHFRRGLVGFIGNIFRNIYQVCCRNKQHHSEVLDLLRNLSLKLDDNNRLISADKLVSLSARFFLLDEILRKKQKIHILFTHKIAKDGNDNEAKHPTSLVPIWDDEINFVTRTWYYTSTALRWENVDIDCVCKIYDNNCNVIESAQMLKDNLLLVGSSKYNKITRIFFEKSSCLSFKFIDIGSDYNIYENHGTSPLDPPPTSTDEAKRKGYDEISVDYALLTRAANPFNEDSNNSSYVFVFAGCKAAGQLALERFFFDPEVLSSLVKFQTDKEAIQVVIRTNYHFDNELGPQLISPIEIIHPKNLLKDNRLEFVVNNSPTTPS